MRPLFLVTVLTVTAASATNPPELNGTWQLTSSPGKLKFETLLIQQSPDKVKITESGSSKKAIDLSCGTDAKECKVKEGTILFWYNGPALVMMENSSGGVTKTRLVPGDDGKTLSLEVTRIVPAGASTTYTFKKQP